MSTHYSRQQRIVSHERRDKIVTTSTKDDRELDALVAERVMGYRWWCTKLRFSDEVRRALCHAEFKNDEWELADGSEEPFSGDNVFIPHYSTDIASAMLVVEKMWERGFGFSCHDLKLLKGWRATFDDDSGCDPIISEKGASYTGKWLKWNADDRSLPRAICEAALAALEATKEKED